MQVYDNCITSRRQAAVAGAAKKSNIFLPDFGYRALRRPKRSRSGQLGYSYSLYTSSGKNEVDALLDEFFTLERFRDEQTAE